MKNEGQVPLDTWAGQEKGGQGLWDVISVHQQKGLEKQSGMVTGKEGIRKEKAG